MFLIQVLQPLTAQSWSKTKTQCPALKEQNKEQEAPHRTFLTTGTVVHRLWMDCSERHKEQLWCRGYLIYSDKDCWKWLQWLWKKRITISPPERKGRSQNRQPSCAPWIFERGEEMGNTWGRRQQHLLTHQAGSEVQSVIMKLLEQLKKLNWNKGLDLLVVLKYRCHWQKWVFAKLCQLFRERMVDP